MLENPTEESPGAEASGYEHLARRAHLYLEQHGGRAREEVLVQQVFGVRGKIEVWGGILAHVLADVERFRRLPSGEWTLARYNEAVHALTELEYVVIDTETTGLNPQRNRMLEVAAIRVKNGQPVETFETLINPHRRIPEFISKFTGIRNEMTASAPGFSQVADKLLEFLGQSIVVGHNIPFDIRFLDYELHRLNRPALLNETVDTISLAVRLNPGLRRPNLDRLAAHLNLTVKNRHRAMADAALTCECFLLLLDTANAQGYKTLGDLRAGRPRLNLPQNVVEALDKISPPPEEPKRNLFQMNLPASVQMDIQASVQVEVELPAEPELEEFEEEELPADPEAEMADPPWEDPVNEVEETGEIEEIERPERIKIRRGWYRDPATALTNRATAHARDVLSRDLLNGLPHRPGVYLMKDNTGKVIYVGKAKNLRDRVSSYYSEPLGYTRKMDGLTESIARIDHIVTGSELEALLLESRLIKQYQPRYNTQLRNYEAYPFIKIDLKQRFSRVSSVREVVDDGARYFGPFKNRKAVETTVEIIEQLFPIRNCTRSFELPEPGVKKRKQAPPCLRLGMGRCPGPCVGNDSEADNDAYLAGPIEEVISFLSGETENMLDTIWARLNRAVQSRNFEKAAELRDIVSQVEKIVSSQQFLAAAVEGNHALICLPSSQAGSVELLCIYRGRLGRQIRLPLDQPRKEAAEMLETAWAALAEEEAHLAATQPGWGKKGGRVIGQEAVDEINIISKWLFAHNGNQAIIPIPNKPPKLTFWKTVVREIPSRLANSNIA